MATDDALVFELVQTIGELVHNLPYNGAPLTNSKRAELVRNAERLAIAAREPAENLYFQSTQVRSPCQHKSLRKLFLITCYRADGPELRHQDGNQHGGI